MRRNGYAAIIKFKDEKVVHGVCWFFGHIASLNWQLVVKTDSIATFQDLSIETKIFWSQNFWVDLYYFKILSKEVMIAWRNGSASDSRSEGCVFESRRGQFFFSKIWRLNEISFSAFT